MSSIVIQGYSRWQRLALKLSRAIPPSLSGLMSGPRRIAVIRNDGATWETRGRWLRPVDIAIDQALIVETRVRFPCVSANELKSVVETWISTDTPFEGHELVVVVSPLARDDNASDGLFYLAAFPSRALTDGLRTLGLKGLTARRVLLRGRQQTREYVASFFARLVPFLQLGLPSLAFVVIGLFAVQLVCGNLAGRTASLNQASQVLVRDVAELQASIEDRTITLERESALRKLLGADSVVSMIGILRRILPDDVEVLRLRYDNASLLLDVRTANALTLAKSLKTPQGWQVAVSGNIASDPATGQDIATLELRRSA